jgi:hypothetical protein
MKRVFFLSIALALVGTLHMNAQMFNAAKYIGKGDFFLGLEPAVYAKSGTDLMMFFHGGVGVTNSVDLSLHAGVGNTTYLGADLEWILARHLTLVTGAHNFNNFGLNSAITYAVPLSQGNYFWFGGHLNIDFADPEVQFPIWIPVGVEVGFRDNVSLLLESEIALTTPARHIIGGGVVIYFK